MKPGEPVRYACGVECPGRRRQSQGRSRRIGRSPWAIEKLAASGQAQCRIRLLRFFLFEAWPTVLTGHHRNQKIDEYGVAS